MAYSLDDKIASYLEQQGVSGARVHETIIIIPTPMGELHRRIQSVINSTKLDVIVAEYKALMENAAA